MPKVQAFDYIELMFDYIELMRFYLFSLSSIPTRDEAKKHRHRRRGSQVV